MLLANPCRSHSLRPSSRTHINTAPPTASSQTVASTGAVPNSQWPAGVWMMSRITPSSVARARGLVDSLLLGKLVHQLSPHPGQGYFHRVAEPSVLIVLDEILELMAERRIDE